MLVAVDTNVFAYAEGGDDPEKAEIARRWLRGFAGQVVMPTQVAGELYNVLTRRYRYDRAVARERVRRWRSATLFQPSSAEDFDDALALAQAHDLQIWDALILVISASSGCRLLLSEDMQDGFVYRGVTVANPFAERLHPLLASMLDTVSGPPE